MVALRSKLLRILFPSAPSVWLPLSFFLSGSAPHTLPGWEGLGPLWNLRGPWRGKVFSAHLSSSAVKARQCQNWETCCLFQSLLPKTGVWLAASDTEAGSARPLHLPGLCRRSAKQESHWDDGCPALQQAGTQGFAVCIAGWATEQPWQAVPRWAEGMWDPQEDLHLGGSSLWRQVVLNPEERKLQGSTLRIRMGNMFLLAQLDSTCWVRQEPKPTALSAGPVLAFAQTAELCYSVIF